MSKDNEGSGPAPLWRTGTERLLLAVVIVLGVLMLGGLGAVLVRIVHLSTQAAAPSLVQGQGAPAQALSPLPEAARLALPAGAVVRSISISGDRLAVYYEAPGGGGIVIVDVASGRTIARLATEPAAR